MAEDILIVDDHAPNILAVRAALEPLGVGLTPAHSGGEALRLLLDRDFILILLDVRMPGLDGIETARLVRARKRSAHTPIIFITAHGRDDREVREAYALGAVDFLSKPVMPEILRAKVNVFVELQRRSLTLEEQNQKLREMEHTQQIAAAAAEADRRKEQFLAMLGHELRNPLVPLVAGLELLRRKLPPAPDTDSVILRTRDAMERQARHLARLVDDLLDVSRINSGKLELRRGPFDLRDVLEQALEICRPMAAKRKQRLEAEVPPTPLAAIGDSVRLTQVFANLLGNAVRYTDEGGHLGLRCEPVGDGVEIRVADNGRGIRPELLPQIFEMYVQEKNGGGGLGLGLMLVKRLVEMHGGSVRASSEGLGKGSEFVVTLPLVSPTGVSHTNMPIVVSSGMDEVREPPRGLRLALVDDNPDIRETMSELLSVCGHQVALAEDGAAGVELILTIKPDVALVDLGLPKLDGYQVAEHVRARLGPRVRMVAMTGFGQDADRRRALEAGFDAHIVKPADLDVLLDALSPEPA